MKKIGDFLCALLFLTVCLAAVFFPTAVTPFVRDGLSLCGRTILPSLFPFMVITQLLTRSGVAERAGRTLAFLLCPLFGIKKELCGAFLTGLAGGFPNGAVSAAYLYQSGKCDKASAERTVALCNNCSPSFLLSVAGAYALGSVKGGLILCLALLCTVFLNSVVLRLCYPLAKRPTYAAFTDGQKENRGNILCDSVKSACENMLVVCGYVVIFYTLSGALCEVLCVNAGVQTVIRGFCEVSGAVLSCKSADFPVNFMLCAAAVGFSGLSVMCQVADVCAKCGLSVRPFLFSRLIGAVAMPLCTAGLLLILPPSAIPVFSLCDPTPINSTRTLWGITTVYAGAFALVMLCFAALCLVSQIWEAKHGNT